MTDVTRILLSDIHMCSTASIAPEAPHPYGWLSVAHAARLGAFLGSPIVAAADQLIFAGDVVDVWAYPNDVMPPTPLDIISAPHNLPIVDGIRQFAAKPNKQVIYVPGNHDMSVDAAFATALEPKLVFAPRFDDGALRVRHGHEDALINGPDPAGRPFPLGYFITRFVATGMSRGRAKPGDTIASILQDAEQAAGELRTRPLAECVIDVVLGATGVALDETVLLPDGSKPTVREIRAAYENLVADWRQHRTSDPINALLNEWNPFNDLEVGPQRLNIFGHSHVHQCAMNPAYGAYLNLGSWCEPEAYFGKTWVDGDALCGQVFSWDGAQATAATTIARVPAVP